MKLKPMQQTFVLHFGEMGSRWGINRTVGQIYALLFVSAQPLNAEEISDHLDFSRSNVSMGLKELQSWNLVRLQHLPNDRRDYFSTPSDVWEIFRVLAHERKKREIEPTLTVLRDILLNQNDLDSSEEDKVALEKLRQMYEIIELATQWFSDIQNIPTSDLILLMKMGSKVQKMLEFKQKISDFNPLKKKQNS